MNRSKLSAGISIAFASLLTGCGSGSAAPTTAPVATVATAPAPSPETPKRRVDKFDVHAVRTGDGITVSLDTDLPDDAELAFDISRPVTLSEDQIDGSGQQTSDSEVTYFHHRMTVGEARAPRLVPVDKGITAEGIAKLLERESGLHGRINSISQVVNVWLMYGCEKGIEGSVVKPCPMHIRGMPYIVESQVTVPVPYR